MRSGRRTGSCSQVRMAGLQPRHAPTEPLPLAPATHPAAWIKAQQVQGLVACSPLTQQPLGDLSLRPNQLARALADGLRAAGLLSQ